MTNANTNTTSNISLRALRPKNINSPLRLKRVLNLGYQDSCSNDINLFCTLLPHGANVCSTEAKLEDRILPKYGTMLFGVQAISIGSNVYYVDRKQGVNQFITQFSNNKIKYPTQKLEKTSERRLILEASVEYQIPPSVIEDLKSKTEKEVRALWTWDSMTSYLTEESKWVTTIQPGQLINLKLHKLPVALRQKCNGGVGIRMQYKNSSGSNNPSDSNIVSYVIKQYTHSMTMTDVDPKLSTKLNSIETSGRFTPNSIFNAGAINPAVAFCFLMEGRILNPKQLVYS